MFNKQARNQLREQIEKGMPITELLLNVNLAAAVRLGEESIVNYFFPPEEMVKPEPSLPNLEEFIQFSLFHEYKQSEQYRYQIGVNCASIAYNSTWFIKECAKDNKKRFFRALRQFIFNESDNKNFNSISNFTRIFYRALHFKQELFDEENIYHYDDGFNINTFITFIIKNSFISPYLSLLESLVTMDDVFAVFIHETLRYAAIACLHIEEDLSAHQKYIKLKQDVYLQEEDEEKRTKKLFELIEIQPVNCDRKKIPFPYFLKNKKLEINYMENIERDEQFIEKIKKEINFDDLKEDELISNEKSNSKFIMFALNLLSVIKEQFLINEFNPNLDKDKIIYYLLICGTFSDSFSNISMYSFNILFYILNNEIFDADDYHGRCEELAQWNLALNPPKIVDEFAEHFKFDPYQPTEKMISGLLVFWNHRYKFGDQKKEEKQVIDNYKTKLGVSALELLLPSVLTEPIYSTRLVNIFIKIVRNLELMLIKLKKNQSEESESICFQIDAIWFELLSYNFKLSPDDSKFVNLRRVLEISLPLSSDSINSNESDLKFILNRPPTNPVFQFLSNIISHQVFFSFKKGIQFRDLFLDVSYSRNWALQTMKYQRILKDSQDDAFVVHDH